MLLQLYQTGTLNPEVIIEHCHFVYQQHDLLAIFIHESPTKPVHMKNGTIEDSYIRSGGSTRKASRNEIGGLMLNSRIPRWEELNDLSLLAENKVLALLDAYAIHTLLKRPAPSTNQEIMHWMETEKMIKKSDNQGFTLQILAQ